MQSKVSLRAKIGTNIVYAMLLACYYWMWARRDWHDYYEVIQNTIVVFTIVFLLLQATRIARRGVDKKDEMATQNLWHIDAICLRIFVAAASVIAFAGAVGAFDGIAAGYALVGTILGITMVRFIVFCILDSKGLHGDSHNQNKGES